MDKEELWQSATAQRIQTLSSSPLFYTVSGGGNVGSKYYVEQLGSPSILKPSFRDLPPCTRLSIGPPSSTSWRQFPLEKVSKTIMGKSPPATTASFNKRFTSRGERYMSPIKVNAKIRHIYSHITTSSSGSHKSSINSISTQTEFDQEDEEEVEDFLPNIHAEDSIEDVVISSRDAFTCMSPPPLDPLFSVPPAYAGKLEDLEKITGHIVIQRFFTKADQAFSLWLEKQLGMNVKSIGVGEEELDNKTEEENSETYQHGSAKTLRESRILERIVEVDDIFSTEEQSFQKKLQTFERKSCGLNDIVKCECFIDYFKRHQEILENSCIQSNTTNLTATEEDLVNQCVEVKILEDTKESEIVDIYSPENPETELRLIKTSSADPDDIINDDETLPNERACIPDIIHAPNKTSITIEEAGGGETNDNEDSEDMKTVIEMPNNQLESQYKVAEYLGKLEISSPASTSANSLNSELEGESSSMQNVCAEDEETAIKRSVSVDSCIGTESSGERIFNDSGILLDSGRMDSNIPEEIEGAYLSEAEVPKSAEIKTEIQDFVEVQEASRKEELMRLSRQTKSIDNDDSINCSRSDRSSAVKQMSDEGGDADQSESNSDSEFCSLRTPLGAGGQAIDDSVNIVEETEEEPNSGMIVVDEDDGSASDVEEPDQFDTIIENHEKEKRLRPIYRKRNVSTQTTKSIGSASSSSTITSCVSSRSTTATSESSFDLEFISKSKKYISHIPPSSRSNPTLGISKKRSYLPTGTSGLNVLNMKFSFGREFESEVSIRVPPPKSPTGSVSSSNSVNYQNIPNAIPSSSKTQTLPQIGNKNTNTKREKGVLPFKLAPVHDDHELKNLWRDVKTKMDNTVEIETDFLVTGSKIKLLSSSGEGEGVPCNVRPSNPMDNGNREETKLPKLITTNEQERIKRSLKRLNKILDH